MDPRSRHGTPAHYAVVLILTVMLLLAGGVARAQDALTPLEPMYMIPQDTFLLGAWINPRQHRITTQVFPLGGPDTPGTRTICGEPLMSPWEYLDTLGLNTMRLMADRWFGESLMDTLYWRKQAEAAGLAPRTNARWIILSHAVNDFPSTLPPYMGSNFYYLDVGYSANVVLFPWDSVDQPTWPSKFDTIRGTVQLDTAEGIRDRPNLPTYERVLTPTNVTPGTVIAQNVMFNWAPVQVHRFPIPWTDPRTAQNASWPFDNRRDTNSIWYLVARLRLRSEDVSIPPDSALLRIHVYWEDTTNGSRAARYCTTYVVTKGAVGSPASGYSDVAFAHNFLRCGGDPGPLASNPGNWRVDLRLEYSGNEEIGLRSVSLRSLVAHTLMDTTTPRVVSGEE